MPFKSFPKFLTSLLIISFLFLLTLSFSTSSLPATQAQQGLATIQSDDSLVTQSGNWNVVSDIAASGRSYLTANNPINDALVIEFEGPSVEIIYLTAPTNGDFAIEIDNILRRTVVTATGTTTYDNHALIDYLDDGPHTLRVYPVSGTIAIDAFIAIPLQTPIAAAREEAAPTLNAPLGSITNPMPTFQWDEVSGMTWYRFYLTKPSGLILDTWYEKGNSIMSCNGSTCSVTPLLGLTNATHTWYVQGWGPSGYSDWAGPANFTLNLSAPVPITITSPTNGATITTPNLTFEWTPDSKAAWYVVTLSGTTTWYDTATYCTSSCLVNKSLTNGNYALQVRGYGPGGYGTLGSTHNFTVAIPKPAILNKISPANASTITDPNVVFEWDHDSNATWYQFHVTGVSTWYSAASICTSTCTLNKTLPNGNYTWYVQGYGPGGYGDWGTGNNFTVAIPKPGLINKISPTDASIVTTPNTVFQWDSDPNATWYQLYVAGASTWYSAASICTSTCTVNKTLSNGSYIWYVQGYGPGGYGEWGIGNTFTVAIPKPGLINKTAPNGNITDPTPDFIWQSDSNATYYLVNISGPSDLIHNQWYLGTTVCNAGTCTLPAPSTYVGSFSWNVRGWGPGGDGQFGTASNFTFNVSLISPTSNIDGRNPTFTWSDLGPETTWYQLSVVPTDGSTAYTHWFQSSQICNGPTCTHNTGITLLSNKSYNWYVQPYGSYGLGTWTPAQPFGIDPIVPNPRSIAGCQIFPADNIWNTPVDTLPLDPNSGLYINTIGATRGLHMDFGSGTWNGGPIGIPYIDVPSTQPTVPITFDYDDESDPGPYPIPSNAPIEGGPNASGDRHVLVLERDNCLLYEVYSAYPQGNPITSWDAGSGAIWDLTSNDIRGELGWTSADAAGLPILPGLITYEEVASGEITHAIRFTVPQTRNTYVWPATHYASSRTGVQYPPMGQRFRLKANFDISGYSAEAQVILQAMKTYGIILADNGSAWYISGAPSESWDNDMLHELDDVTGQYFEAVNVSSLMVDPLSGQVQSP